jgi:hypothetical protein
MNGLYEPATDEASIRASQIKKHYSGRERKGEGVAVVFDEAEVVAAVFEGPNVRRFGGRVAQGGENPPLRGGPTPPS